MAEKLPKDFRDFLKLCNQKRAKYLLIGGYAVVHYGYIRTTGDMDVWIERSDENARKMVEVVKKFGFRGDDVEEELFLELGSVVRMGFEPLRLEILNRISGVSFADCYARRNRVVVDGIKINIISLPDLKANKAASGRLKDLNDLENL